MNKKVNKNFQKVIYFYENFYKADLNKKINESSIQDKNKYHTVYLFAMSNIL